MDTPKPFVVPYTTHAKVGVAFAVLGVAIDAFAFSLCSDGRHGHGVGGAASVMASLLFAGGTMAVCAMGALVACGPSRRWRGGGERTVRSLCLAAMGIGLVDIVLVFAS